MADLVVPAVLDTPAAGFAVNHVDAGEEHGVGHGGLVVIQPFRLVHLEIGVVYAGVVEEIGVPQALVAVHLLAGVAAHPDGHAVLEHPHGDVLHDVDVDVQVGDAGAVHYVAEVLDGVGAVRRAGAAWVVDEADEILHGSADVLLGEFEGRHLTVAVELAVLVLPLPIELGRRVAQVNAEDLVDGAESFLLRVPHGAQAGLVGVEAADVAGALADLVVEAGIHTHGIAGALGLGHDGLRNDAVLAHEADEHIPLAAVAQGLPQEPGHDAVVNRPVGGLDDGLKDVVGALHLVPEHDVALAELELLDVEDVAGLRAEQVETGKHPAATGSRLVGDAPVVEDGGEAVGCLGDDVAVEGDIVDVVLGDDVLHQLVVGLGSDGILKLGHGGGVQGARVGLGGHGASPLGSVIQLAAAWTGARLPTTSVISASARSISSSVVKRPTVRRRVPMAYSVGTRIASRTWDSSTWSL